MRLSFTESEIDPKTQLSPAVSRAAAEPSAEHDLPADWVDPDKTRVVPALELAARRAAVTSSSDDTKDEENEPKTFLGLKLPQVIGGVLASTTAAILGAQLGVAGTIVGAAMTSGIITIGGAIYSAGIAKSHTGLGAVFVRFRKDGKTSLETAPDEQAHMVDGDSAEEPVRGSWRDRISPVKLLAAAAAIFLLAAVVVTGLEALRGESFAGGGQTTVGQVSREGLSSNPTSSSDTRQDSGVTQPQREATQPATTPEPTATSTPEPAPTDNATTPTTEPTQTTAPTTEPGSGSADGSTGSDSGSDRTGTDTTDPGTTGSGSDSQANRSGTPGSSETGSSTPGSGSDTTDSGTTGSDTTGSRSPAANSLSENSSIAEGAATGE